MIILYYIYTKKYENFKNNNILDKITIGIKTFCLPKCLNECLMNITKYYKNINILISDDSTNEIKKKIKLL